MRLTDFEILITNLCCKGFDLSNAVQYKVQPGGEINNVFVLRIKDFDVIKEIPSEFLEEEDYYGIHTYVLNVPPFLKKECIQAKVILLPFTGKATTENALLIAECPNTALRVGNKVTDEIWDALEIYRFDEGKFSSTFRYSNEPYYGDRPSISSKEFDVLKEQCLLMDFQKWVEMDRFSIAKLERRTELPYIRYSHNGDMIKAYLSVEEGIGIPVIVSTFAPRKAMFRIVYPLKDITAPKFSLTINTTESFEMSQENLEENMEKF